MNEKNWHTVVEQAEHYLAIGHDEVYLSGENNGDYPWEYVVGCKPGGSHRLDISTDVWFNAEHPSGMKFRWTFDIEPHSANGSGQYQIARGDVIACLSKLQGQARDEFRRYLDECSAAVQKRADEYLGYASRMAGDAQILRQLASEAVQP